jgi:type III pantothenate kinase
MTKQNTLLVLDAGNTAIKIAVFTDGEITEIQRFETNNLTTIDAWSKKYYNTPSILSSVRSLEETNQLARMFFSCMVVNNDTSLPIQVKYSTPKSLGIDRICNAIAIAKNCPNQNAVSIDLGTCLKFDFVNDKNEYLGGSISPGIQMRYKALNAYTANLPLIDEYTSTPLIGMSSKESIHSGVVNGIQAEINQLMQRYSEEFNDLTFFMTGGDIHYFDFHLKNNTFVDENLTLKGLYQIYLFNAH